MARRMKQSGVVWIGQIPEGWRVERLKNLFDFGKGLNITKADLTESGVAVVSYGQIHSKRNSGTHLSDELLRYVAPSYLQSDPSALLHEGDLVFADTSEDVDGIGNCVLMDVKREVMAGYHTIVFHPHDKTSSKFLSYLFKSDSWRNQIRSMAYGIKVYSLTHRMLRKCTVVVPPLPEQQAIAAYLDDRCAKIDAAIEQAKTAIEEFRKWKASVIFEAVTGKDQGGKMKDSGVEWIGKVPEGWRISRVKFVSMIQNGSNPKSEGSIPVYGSGEASFKTCGEYKEGPTVLIGRKGATLHIPHYIEGKYWNVDTAFDVKMKDENSIRWFYYLACCFDYKAYVSQTTLPSMTQTDYNDMKIPCPPCAEQQRIVSCLDGKCAAIDALVAEKESLIVDLEAYRKSLISEVVTGKREVA